MKKLFLISGLFLLIAGFSLTRPSVLKAVEGDICDPSIAISCGIGFKCVATDVAGVPGICNATGICGGQRELCCSTGNSCETGLSCNDVGLCTEPADTSGGTAGCIYQSKVGGGGDCRGKDSQCNKGDGFYYQGNDLYCGQNDNDKDACKAAPAVSCVRPGDAEHDGGLLSDHLVCDAGKGINTAIGCIPIGSTNDLVGFILKWGIGIGGGIAFLLIVFGGFQVMTSNGVPEKVQAGKELITSAITGLVMLIFSIFILKLIGIDILGLNQFGFGG